MFDVRINLQKIRASDSIMSLTGHGIGGRIPPLLGRGGPPRRDYSLQREEMAWLLASHAVGDKWAD